jgi:hypothetical protein
LRRALHSVVPFQQIIAPLGFVLADPDKLHRGQQFSFLRVASKKKIRTDKLFSLHFFITGT